MSINSFSLELIEGSAGREIAPDCLLEGLKKEKQEGVGEEERMEKMSVGGRQAIRFLTYLSR